MKQPIFTGSWGKCHIQGIAVDEEHGYIYYSFTTKLVKSTLDGKIVGCVDGLVGHLGCIAFNREDGRIYGSLEYKRDAIGREILEKLGQSAELTDAFYIAIFDGNKIDRMGMDAEKDGVMKNVYLEEVLRDYSGTGLDRWGNPVPHRYGCSGIDGLTFGPMFGEPPDSKQYLFVSYGVYSDVNRDDNDHQVILCYDTENWDTYAAPLSQSNMHRSGPSEPADKLFVYTGNTRYGVQNLEYDPYKQVYFMAVYTGEKKQFPNYHLYAADARQAPEVQQLRGLNEYGKVVPLFQGGQRHEPSGIHGWNFPYGSTGLFACGDGRYYISENHVSRSGQCSLIYRYVWDDDAAFVLPD